MTNFGFGGTNPKPPPPDECRVGILVGGPDDLQACPLYKELTIAE